MLTCPSIFLLSSGNPDLTLRDGWQAVWHVATPVQTYLTRGLWSVVCTPLSLHTDRSAPSAPSWSWFLGCGPRTQPFVPPVCVCVWRETQYQNEDTWNTHSCTGVLLLQSMWDGGVTHNRLLLLPLHLFAILCGGMPVAWSVRGAGGTDREIGKETERWE